MSTPNTTDNVTLVQSLDGPLGAFFYPACEIDGCNQSATHTGRGWYLPGSPAWIGLCTPHAEAVVA